MKGDFSRVTLNEEKHYSLVLMQQGRVLLDNDWNEQGLTLWLAQQKLIGDLIGEHGGPEGSFEIYPMPSDETPSASDFMIRDGRYYVQGAMCENEESCRFTDQPDYPPFSDYNPNPIDEPGTYLIYLHVWLRHITHLEDEALREVALGGPDTTTRVKTVWQVKAKKTDLALYSDDGAANRVLKENYEQFEQELGDEIYPRSSFLKARAIIPRETVEPCRISPENRYRGAENQLYRVEIHRGGLAFDAEANNQTPRPATFKWSRENGSVVFPIEDINGSVVTVSHLGRDTRFGLKPGDWVEVVDDDYVLLGKREKLLRVGEVDPVEMQVVLSESPAHTPGSSKHPLLRRWDQKGDEEGGMIVVEEGKWVELEDGVEIWFEPPPSQILAHYCSGEWWFIPARTATGDVEWPKESDGSPLSQPAMHPTQGFAPLALVEFSEDGIIADNNDIIDLRRKLAQRWE